MQTPASEQAQFISFRVDEQGQDALLNWQVINESVQTREYVIERRTKGQGFTEIGTIQARQNNSVQTYRFTDDQARLIAGRNISTIASGKRITAAECKLLLLKQLVWQHRGGPGGLPESGDQQHYPTLPC